MEQDETQEVAKEDRDRVVGLLGHKVTVRLTNVEARGVEMLATLDEVREHGIVLSKIGELGSGPTMFCPWDSLKQVRERPLWLRPPHEKPGPEEARLEQEFYELREATVEEVAPEPPVEHRRASARNLHRVVPVAQRQTVGEITVTITSLELFGEGVGILRYRISGSHGFWGIPEPELVVRDRSGRELPWSPQGGGASDTEADGEVEVRELPETGELEVEVSRLVTLVFDEEAGKEVVEASYDGSWIFRFSI